MFSTSAFAYDPIYDWAMREANKEEPYIPDVYYQIQIDDLEREQFEHDMEHSRREADLELNRDRGFDLDYDY